MNKFIAAIMLMIAMAFGGVAACTTIGQVTGQESVARYDEKALLAAELSFSFALDGIQLGIGAGRIDAAKAQALLPHMETAKAGIEAARKAYRDGQRVDASVATGNALTAITEIVRLLEEYGVLRKAAPASATPPVRDDTTPIPRAPKWSEA